MSKENIKKEINSFIESYHIKGIKDLNRIDKYGNNTFVKYTVMKNDKVIFDCTLDELENKYIKLIKYLNI